MFLKVLAELEDKLKPIDFGHLEEKESEFELTFSVPGFEKDQLEVTIDGGKVVVRGKNKKSKVYLVTYLYGGIDTEKAKARLNENLLVITVPKKRSGILVTID